MHMYISFKSIDKGDNKMIAYKNFKKKLYCYQTVGHKYV